MQSVSLSTKLIFTLALVIAAAISQTQAAPPPAGSCPARPQAQLMNSMYDRSLQTTTWSLYRQKYILPALMQQYDVRMWVVSGTEYSEEPVYSIIWPIFGLESCDDDNSLDVDLSLACVEGGGSSWGKGLTVFVYSPDSGRALDASTVRAIAFEGRKKNEEGRRKKEEVFSV